MIHDADGRTWVRAYGAANEGWTTLLDPVASLSAPFPPLRWSSSAERWSGRASLPAWSGCLDCSGPYGVVGEGSASDGGFNVSVERADGLSEPTAAQSLAYAFQLQNADAVLRAALVALKPWYDRLRPRWLEAYSAEEMDRIMPEVMNPADLSARIGLHEMHVHAGRVGDMAFTGLELGCTWDEEHGAGVLMLGTEVVKVGAADTAFSWLPPTAELS